MIRDPVVDASSAPGMRFSLGRLRSWLPQSLVGRVIKPNPDARSRDADGNGDEDSMSVDLSHGPNAPPRPAQPSESPQGPKDGSAVSSQTAGWTVSSVAYTPTSGVDMLRATAYAPVNELSSKSKPSLEYQPPPGAALACAPQDKAPSNEHSPVLQMVGAAVDIPRKVPWPCVSTRCPPAMRDAPVAWTAARIRRLFPIGKGFMSEVYHAVDTASGTQVALKVYDKSKMHRRDVDQVEEEVAIHIHLTHPNILGLYAAFADAQHLFIVLELASGDDLYKRMSRIPVSEPLITRRFLQPILSALEHCHARGILHRDLKPENVLMMEDQTCKLCDFGFSINTGVRRPVSRLGTLDFMAPEIVMAGRKHLDGVKDEVHNDADNYVPKSDRPSYTSAVDVWALGGVLYELLVRVTPFASQSKNRTMRKICGGELVIPDTLSPEAADFVRQCLRVDPAERPSCSQLLAHPLVAKHCPEVAAAAREKLAMDALSGPMSWAVSASSSGPTSSGVSAAHGPTHAVRPTAPAPAPALQHAPTWAPRLVNAPGSFPAPAPPSPAAHSLHQRPPPPLLPTIEPRSPVASLGGSKCLSPVAPPPRQWGRAATRSMAPSEVMGDVPASPVGVSSGNGGGFGAAHADEVGGFPAAALVSPTKVMRGWDGPGAPVQKRHSIEGIRRAQGALQPLSEEDNAAAVAAALGFTPGMGGGVAVGASRPIVRTQKRRSQDVPSMGPII